MSLSQKSSSENLIQTPLYDLHLSHGGKMVPFAGYEMAVQYKTGIMGEHLHVREKAGLFDISHMGVMELQAKDENALIKAIEQLVPSDIASLKEGEMRYSVLLNDNGGIEDDLIITRLAKNGDTARLGLVVNGARKHHDFDYISSHLPNEIKLIHQTDKGLLALQGPAAVRVLSKWVSGVKELSFMTAMAGVIEGMECHIYRCGYTGEDGFEIAINADHLAPLAQLLLSDEIVMLIGLGARDSLRLEAGLSLYGSDLDDATSPIEAGLRWTVGKQRRTEDAFLGAEQILNQLQDGPPRRRVALTTDERLPARGGAKILDHEGQEIGVITSGGFSPSLQRPIAIGFATPKSWQLAKEIFVQVRGKNYPWKKTKLPFVPHQYVR